MGPDEDVTLTYLPGQLEELLSLQEIVGRRDSELPTRPPPSGWEGEGLLGVQSSGDHPGASPEVIVLDDDGEID